MGKRRNKDKANAELAEIRLHLATLRTRVDELAALQGHPMEPDGILVPGTADVASAAAQANAIMN